LFLALLIVLSLRNNLDWLAIIIAVILGIILIATIVVIIPNPRCNPALLDPIGKVANYITMFAMPAFLIAWFYPSIPEGCFDCFKDIDLIKKGFDGMANAF
jgi:hypothetical protein